MVNDYKEQHIAVIDLGSNTTRLIVIKAIPGYSFRLEDEIREVVRLRQGLTEEGLNPAAVKRALSTLRLFKKYCENAQVDTIIPIATSAVRDAKNGLSFIEMVERETGLSLRVLSGEEEAYYGVLGVLNEIPLETGYVVDIGGGSVQISEVLDGSFVRGEALPIGALTLTERFVQTDPITDPEFQAVEQEIDLQLSRLEWLKPDKDRPLIGLGGAIRNLAWMDSTRSHYPLNTLHGYSLSYHSLLENIYLLRSLPLKKRAIIPGLKSDRADIILPGALALQAIMKRLTVERVTVSVNGLREGVFMERFWRSLDYPVAGDVRHFGVLNLARNYHFHHNHTAHMRFLTSRIYKQLAPLHKLDNAWLDLLEAAAILHDIGAIVGYDRHQYHSQTLIEFNGIPGFSPREIAMIALLARYHRRGKPSTAGYRLVLQPGDGTRLRKLVSILRFAEYLDRGRYGAISDVSVTWDRKSMTLCLHTGEYPLVELWQVKRNAVPLLESVFHRQVKLEVAVENEPPTPA